METIDLTWLTEKDLDDASAALEKIGFTTFRYSSGAYRLHYLTASKEFESPSDIAPMGPYLFLANYAESTVENARMSLELRCNGESLARYSDTNGLLPKYVRDVAFRDKLGPRARRYKKLIIAEDAKIQAIYNEAIGCLRAQSKEDFYDDASDYQDDEPSDFGDAANYDENLVRRIRKVIES